MLNATARIAELGVVGDHMRATTSSCRATSVTGETAVLVKGENASVVS